MPGFETVGKEEQANVNKIFTESNGVLYRYGFDNLRKHYFVKQFEDEFAKKLKIKHALAVSSGSAALKCSLQALGVGKGDEVITQSHTFIATVEAICEVGAKPVITDIDKSLNMDPESLQEMITSRTKVVIPVHMSGVSCNLRKIRRVCDGCGDIKILEDNAQSPGGTYQGQLLGTIGDMGIFSFDGGKMLTTGEGGMITTNNLNLYSRARSFSDHGHANNETLPRGEDDCIGLGFNYKMLELQGAVGLAQLQKMDNTINQHKKNKQQIIDEIKDTVELRKIPNPLGDIGDSISFFLPNKEKAKSFVHEWKRRGHGTKNLPDALRWHFAYYWYHMPLIHKGLLQSKNILQRTISIPVMYNMSEEQISIIIKDIKETIKKIE